MPKFIRMIAVSIAIAVIGVGFLIRARSFFAKRAMTSSSLNAISLAVAEGTGGECPKDRNEAYYALRKLMVDHRWRDSELEEFYAALAVGEVGFPCFAMVGDCPWVVLGHVTYADDSFFQILAGDLSPSIVTDREFANRFERIRWGSIVEKWQPAGKSCLLSKRMVNMGVLRPQQPTCDFEVKLKATRELLLKTSVSCGCIEIESPVGQAAIKAGEIISVRGKYTSRKSAEISERVTFEAVDE